VRCEGVPYGRLLATVLCWILSVCLGSSCDVTKTTAHTDAHRRADTENTLHVLAASTMHAVWESNQYAPAQGPMFVQWIFTHDPRAQGDIRLGSLRFDATRKVFLDAWGTPVRLVSESGALVGFGSCGPNLRWDGGRGDDVTVRLAEMDVPTGPPGETFRQ